MNHLQQLVLHEPNLKQMRILDVGAGKGSFMMQALDEGIDILGLEKNEQNIQIAKQKMAEKNYDQNRIIQGLVESLPWEDDYFDFANASEVLEHVEDPDKMLAEMQRILKTSGQAYVSVPNRFGFWDPHFHLYFINWMPRAWAMKILTLLKKHKDYNTDSGYQSLMQMHYMTYGNAVKLFNRRGFNAIDIRVNKIKNKAKNILLQKILSTIYILLRPWTFSTFHFLIIKN